MDQLRDFTRGWRSAENGEPAQYHQGAEWLHGFEGWQKRRNLVAGATITVWSRSR